MNSPLGSDESSHTSAQENKIGSISILALPHPEFACPLCEAPPAVRFQYLNPKERREWAGAGSREGWRDRAGRICLECFGLAGHGRSDSFSKGGGEWCWGTNGLGREAFSERACLYPTFLEVELRELDTTSSWSPRALKEKNLLQAWTHPRVAWHWPGRQLRPLCPSSAAAHPPGRSHG